MNIPIFKILNADDAATALLGKDKGLRVWRDGAPEDPVYPYVAWFLVGGEPINHVDEPALDDDVMIQIDIYAKSEDERDDVYRAVRNALKHHCYIVGLNPIGQPGQGSYRESFTTAWLVEA